MRRLTPAGLAATYAALSIAAAALVPLLARAPAEAPSIGQAGEPFDLRLPSRPSSAPEAVASGGETLARPVFSPTRRPYAAPSQEEPIEMAAEAIPPPAAPSSDRIALGGVYISDTGRRALIISPAAPDGAWLPVGAAVEGWTITGIEAETATLSAPPDIVVLQLFGEIAAAE